MGELGRTLATALIAGAGLFSLPSAAGSDSLPDRRLASSRRSGSGAERDFQSALHR